MVAIRSSTSTSPICSRRPFTSKRSCGSRADFPLVRSLAMLAIVGLGALGLQLSTTAPLDPDPSLHGAEVEIVAHVTRDGIARAGFFGSPRQVVELETESVVVNGATQDISTGIRANIY